VLEFFYRLVHRVPVDIGRQRQIVPVEVKIHVRFERCPGPMALGDLVYSNTLLPGEKVRLFTTDRRTRFTFDSSTKLSYRTEQTSEEHFFLGSISDSMSDLSVRDEAHSSNKSKGSSTGHAGTGNFLDTLFNGPSVNVSGTHTAESTSDFVRELSSHAHSATRRAETGARASNTVSIGEVQTRTHAEGESSDHFESSSREFSNPNHCHAVTFFFYQINKTQTIKFTIEAIERRVIDPAADTKVAINKFVSDGEVSTIPNGVLATDPNRLKVEETGRASVAARDLTHESVREGVALDAAGGVLLGTAARQRFVVAEPAVAEPISSAFRKKALQQIDSQLAAAGLLNAQSGAVSPIAQKNLSFEIQVSLPTPGVLVKGCLDDCDICEPEVHRAVELDLERKQLENELLKRQIELLDKSQEYRCCPAGETEETP
jgi:hypothetical protein